ncbi:MAG: NrfD/PsrC family molybdoenzyme membrane anchor subunit [Polyangia bacterium]
MSRSSRENFSRRVFFPWIALWSALLIAGLYAGYTCLRFGLNRTNMDNQFGFGLWIFLDLAVIALGAGAFFTGFLFYIMRRKELEDVIGSAVVIGLACYSGAILALLVDVGQPLRAWFTFWHPNAHSMLAEVTFCITCYLLVLVVEYIPLLLRHRRLSRVPSLLVFEGELHRVMPVLAGVGACLSFFHQGSLGGLYGVLDGRPFAARAGLGPFPTTFFLFVLSSIAVGPSFLLLINKLTETITRKRLASRSTYGLLARISGWLLAVYGACKCVDTLYWLNAAVPATGVVPRSFYIHPPFGVWILLVEVGLCCGVPAVILCSGRLRARQPLTVLAASLACLGVVINRFAMTIQTLALPTLPFDDFSIYLPSWQETLLFVGIAAWGVLLFSLSYRYLPLYPRVRSKAGETTAR